MAEVTVPPDLQMVQQENIVPVLWNGSHYVVSLRGVELKATPERPRDGVDIYFAPPMLYDVRVRKATEPWGPGILLPYNTPTFLDLEDDSEYDVKITALDSNQKPIRGATLEQRFIPNKLVE